MTVTAKTLLPMPPPAAAGGRSSAGPPKDIRPENIRPENIRPHNTGNNPPQKAATTTRPRFRDHLARQSDSRASPGQAANSHSAAVDKPADPPGKIRGADAAKITAGGQGGLEGVKIDHQEIDGANAVVFHGCHVAGVVA